MKPYNVKNFTEKIINVSIVALVVLGTAAFGLVNQITEGGEWLSKLFLAFLGAIITIQVIPGLILLGAMLKGLASLNRKEAPAAESEDDTGNE